MSQSIKVELGRFTNTNLVTTNREDPSSAKVTQWSNQGFWVEYVHNGQLIYLQFVGSFSANGTPATLSEVSGQVSTMVKFIGGQYTSTQSWSQGFDVKDIATFNPVAQLAALDHGLVFRGSLAAREDEVMGGSSNDIFIGNGGWDSFYGEGGLDHVVIQGNLSDYAVGKVRVDDYRIDDSSPSLTTIDGWAVQARDGSREKRVDLVEVERIQFNDINVALDTDGVAGQAYRLYKAAFNRQPDEGGLGYWINQIDKGTGLQDVSYGFLASAEFISLYGSNVSNQEFINALYLNVLQRGADQSGFDYWEKAMADGFSREGILLFFSDSVENRANVEPLIANGIQYESWDPIIV